MPPPTHAAEAYEDLLVPALFAQFTGPVLDAARVGPGDRVLDVACGTGILARDARGRVGPEGHVAGVDVDPAMVAVAGRLAPGIAWSEGTAEALPAEDASLDAVVSQFGLMFFRDGPQAAREMLRVLAPGGRLAVAVWGGLDENPAYASSVALIERLGGPAAGMAMRAPFSMGDPAGLARLFEDAGASSVDVRSERGTARFPSIEAMVTSDLRGWLPLCGVHLDEARVAEILAAAEDELAAYRTASGEMTFDVEAQIVTGKRE